MQIKAEDKILGEVLSTLRSVSDIATAASSALKPLQAKQELTQLLLENERSRLRVWLFPLDSERKYHMPTLGGKNPAEVRASITLIFTSSHISPGNYIFLKTGMVRECWAGDPTRNSFPLAEDAK